MITFVASFVVPAMQVLFSCATTMSRCFIVHFLSINWICDSIIRDNVYIATFHYKNLLYVILWLRKKKRCLDLYINCVYTYRGCSNGDVRINWTPVTTKGTTIKSGDIVSVRGKGRLKVTCQGLKEGQDHLNDFGYVI